ncbi:MAG: hypothetical protein K2Q32_04145 [Alphaproteobacteria bacterium]|nr:hypothetical protein [Alphaproteobacteria bacterium]
MQVHSADSPFNATGTESSWTSAALETTVDFFKDNTERFALWLGNLATEAATNKWLRQVNDMMGKSLAQFNYYKLPRMFPSRPSRIRIEDQASRPGELHYV